MADAMNEGKNEISFLLTLWLGAAFMSSGWGLELQRVGLEG